MKPRICLLGFGEVGQMLATQLRPCVDQLVAWDSKFADANSAPSRAATRIGTKVADTAAAAVADANLVICAVTAAQIVDAANSVSSKVTRDCWYFDLNSTSPGAKQTAAGVIDAAGGRFVEAAIMSPIAPLGNASPMLLGGAHAAPFLPLARELGFSGATVFSPKLGAASAAKMCRSVVVKGLEALLLESLMSARRLGVEEAVLDSLQGFLGDDWRSKGSYMISRALLHGTRRAEEMREVARTVTEAGLPPRMSSASVDWQEWAGQQWLDPEWLSTPDKNLGRVLDGLLAAQSRRSAT